MRWYNKFKIDEIIKYALDEDIGYEDVSTNAIFEEARDCKVKLIAKEDGILAGSYIFERCFKLLDSNVDVNFLFLEGEKFKNKDVIAEITGEVHSVLTGERIALNFLQRMSGIATFTNDIIKSLEGSNIDIVDTRKTTPSFRIFEKYSVKVGGGKNHRFNLSDMIMLKDNHIAAKGGVKEAILSAREYSPYVKKIVVETENLDMVKEAISVDVDIIMLDNMNFDDIKKAIDIIDNRCLIECSGNMDKEKIEKIKDLDIDYISSGAIIYSSGIIDLSLKELELL